MNRVGRGWIRILHMRRLRLLATLQIAMGWVSTVTKDERSSGAVREERESLNIPLQLVYVTTK